MVLFNLLKGIFIYKKFKITPFDKNFLILLIISILQYLLIYFLPNFESYIINILYKTFLILILYTLLIFKLKVIKIDFNLKKIFKQQ